jgi:hypothetical protein
MGHLRPPRRTFQSEEIAILQNEFDDVWSTVVTHHLSLAEDSKLEVLRSKKVRSSALARPGGRQGNRTIRGETFAGRHMQRALTVIAIALLPGVALSLSYINWGVLGLGATNVESNGAGGYTVSTSRPWTTYVMQPDGMGGYIAIAPESGPLVASTNPY